MTSPFEVVTLRGGAHAIRHRELDEVMHPCGGPWVEANRLYVEQLGPGRRVLDVGLGAAANAVAALSAARGPLEVCSLEVDLAPLRLALEDEEGFAYLEPWREAAQALIQHGRWEKDPLRWTLLLGDAQQTLDRAEGTFDRVFFDPFSPRGNPGLWSPAFLSRVRARCAEQALLATYSTATPTRVSLLCAGFFVGEGVSTGTRPETTVAATQRSLLAKPLGPRWLERWQRSSARAPHGTVLDAALERAVLGHPQWLKAPGQR